MVKYWLIHFDTFELTWSECLKQINWAGKVGAQTIVPDY